MTRGPGAGTLLDHLERESLRFRRVLAGCDPGARVPACPDWDASDLLWHLAEVQWFWGTVVRHRPQAPPDDRGYPPRPGSYQALLEAFDEYSAGFVHELRRADPDEAAWSWVSDHTVGFTVRRQTHEALIHRLDAEQAAGDPSGIDPALAADGVLECLDVLYGPMPDSPDFRPTAAGDPGLVLVECADTGDRFWARLGHCPAEGAAVGEPAVRVIEPPGGEPDAVVRGRAADLDAWLWRRADDSSLEVSGDRAAFDHLVAATSSPIT